MDVEREGKDEGDERSDEKKRGEKEKSLCPSTRAARRRREGAEVLAVVSAGLTGRLLCIEMPATMPREWTGRCKRSAKMK